MAKCTVCGGAGWLFSLTPAGLCDECEHLVSMEIAQRARAVEDSAKASEATLNPQSKITHLDLQVENLEALARYEERGIPTIEGKASARLDKTRMERDALVLKTARSELKEFLRAAREAALPKDKIKLCSEFLLKLQEYEGRLADKKILEALTRRVRESVARIRANAKLEEAESAVKGGEKGAAKKLYLEALNELNAAGEDTSEKKQRLASIEAKIAELS